MFFDNEFKHAFEELKTRIWRVACKLENNRLQSAHTFRIKDITPHFFVKFSCGDWEFATKEKCSHIQLFNFEL